MDEVLWLRDKYPEITGNTNLPLTISGAQCLSGHLYNEDEACAEWELGRQRAVIGSFDGIACLLLHSPQKNMSRMFS